MKLHRLEKARNYDVREWLIKSLELNEEQQRKLRDYEIIRFSNFEFYKMRESVKPSFIMRLSIIPLIILYLVLIIFLPISYIVTGKVGYSEKMYKFVSDWRHKTGWK